MCLLHRVSIRADGQPPAISHEPTPQKTGELEERLTPVTASGVSVCVCVCVCVCSYLLSADKPVRHLTNQGVCVGECMCLWSAAHACYLAWTLFFSLRSCSVGGGGVFLLHRIAKEQRLRWRNMILRSLLALDVGIPNNHVNLWF